MGVLSVTFRQLTRSVCRVSRFFSRCWSFSIDFSGGLFCCVSCGVHYRPLYRKLLPSEESTGTTEATAACETGSVEQRSGFASNVCDGCKLFCVVRSSGARCGKWRCSGIAARDGPFLFYRWILLSRSCIRKHVARLGLPLGVVLADNTSSDR